MERFDRQSHWQSVYATKAEGEVSWFEEAPEISLALLDEAGLTPGMSVIDIGGGASRLVDALSIDGKFDVSVLDLSAAALDVARARLPGDANVRWFVSDVTAWTPDRAYDLWHDRAAFHFLTDPADQAAYVHVMTQALKEGGMAIIGTFAIDGPAKCSNLPVARYDANSLRTILGDQFQLVATRTHEHVTPWSTGQRFQFSTFGKIA